jgi:cohesin loading factor subunit SCC2
VTLITLETSQHRGISELACAEHRVLHEKHESTIEREYAKAMQSAYNYQRDVVKETRGATTNPFQAKLHLWLDVLKISKSKNRQRFFDKLCSQLDFDPSEMDAAAGDEGALPPAVDYCRFVIENITYIEYATVGEVMATVAALEKLVATIGTGLAHILESELLNLNLDALNAPASAAEGGDTTSAGEAVPPQQVLKAANVDPSRLRQLTASSMILHAVWESRTHLRRLYSLGLNKRDQKAKAMAKDLAKAPVKVQGVHGDKIWEELATIMSSLQSEQLMVARCKSFAEGRCPSAPNILFLILHHQVHCDCLTLTPSPRPGPCLAVPGSGL